MMYDFNANYLLWFYLFIHFFLSFFVFIIVISEYFFSMIKVWFWQPPFDRINVFLCFTVRVNGAVVSVWTKRPPEAGELDL